MMDWNINPSSDSNSQAMNFKFQGPLLEQQLPGAGGFSQNHASPQIPCIYPANNQILTIPSNTIIVNNLPVLNTGGSHALRPNLPSVANKGFGPSGHLSSMPPVSVSAVLVQMTPAVTQNSDLMRNVDTSSRAVLPANPVNPQKRGNPYKPMENYNNQSRQICSNSGRKSYQQACKNTLSLKSQPTLVPYYYTNGPLISQAGASVPLNSSSNHLNSQNFSYTLQQSSQSQINGQNGGMTVTMQTQQYASDHVNHAQYIMPTNGHNRNTTQIPPYTVPTQVTNKGTLPPPYPVPSVQTNYGQFSLPQSIANTSNENVQNYSSPMPDLNNTYSSYYGQKGQSVQITKETSDMNNIAYNVNERGSEDRFFNESTKSAVDFKESVLSSVQAARIVSLDDMLPPQISQTLEQQRNPSNVPGNLPDNSPKDILEITKESLLLEYKKMHEIKSALVKCGEAYKRKRQIYLSAKKKNQASSDHNQNLNQSCNITQNEPLHNTNPTQQFPLYDTSQNQSSSVSCDSNETKDISLLLQEKDSHLMPILQNLLKGTIDENMLRNVCFGKVVTHQNKKLPADGSSSRNNDKSDYNVNNAIDTLRPSSEIPQMNSTQESLPYTKNDVGLMQISRSANHQLKKTATSGRNLLHLKLSKNVVENLRNCLNHKFQSSVQSSANSNDSSLPMNKAVKESTENSHHSQSTDPTLTQRPKENNPLNEHDTSNSASVHSEKVVVQEGTAQNPNPQISTNTFRNEGSCSLEELKTSLALWRKNLPSSLNENICKSTQSTVSMFSSEDGNGDKKPQQCFKNLSNTLTQNDHTKFTSGSGETTQSSVLTSPGKKHDISSSLSKGSEPQVAIVTPLMLSKDNVQIAVQKNSPSLEISYPAGEKNKVHSLQTFLSTVSRDKRIQNTACSPSDSVKYSKDLDINKAGVSIKENGIVKVETGENFGYEISQVIGSHSPGSRGKLPLDNQDSQKCVQSQSGPNSLEPRDTDELAQNDPLLKISSVCTLVKGDALYNSQIANIFGPSPLEPGMENDSSSNDLEPYFKCNDKQSGILKSEPESDVSTTVLEEDAVLSPGTLTKAVEEIFQGTPDLEVSQSHKTSDKIKEINYEEIKNSVFPESVPFSEKKLDQNASCSGVYSTDLVRDNQELYQNKDDQICSSIADGLYAINKEGTAECVSVEENEKHTGSSTEAPLTLLSDQLTELSNEFPYGIGYLKTLNLTGNNAPADKHDRGNTENVQISGTCPDPSDAIDQIKITILNSQQMKEMFPEDKQQFSNKTEKAEDDHLKADSEDNVARENISPIKISEAMGVDVRETSPETTLKRRKRTYCCLNGWLSSVYALKRCSCTLVKESESEQKVALHSQTQTIAKDRPKASEKCDVDFTLDSQLSVSPLSTVTNKVSSGIQHDRTSNKISEPTDAKEYKLHSLDQAASPLPSLEKLIQNLEQTNKDTKKEQSHHTPQPLKTEVEEVKIDLTDDHLQARENSSTGEAQRISNTEDVIVARNLCRTDSSTKQRTEKVMKPKVDSHRHRHIEIKHSTNYERYKIKRDSSETHMIKGPSRKGLKRQKAMKRMRKALAIQHKDTINVSNFSSVGSVSKECENPQYISASHSQRHLNGKKFGKIKDLEKRFGYKKGESKETISENNKHHTQHTDTQHSEHHTQHTHIQNSEHHTQHTEHHSECTKPSIKRISLDKYAYSKDRKNAWKCRSSHFDNSKTLTPQKQRGRPSSISKMLSPGKEAMLDANKREKRSERSLSDKKSCFNRRTNKLSISLQREPKNTYLNRVAFRRTAHKTIFLTNLEPSHSKSVWRVKSDSLSGLSRDKRKNSSPPQEPKAEKLPMLQFKMCPDILFRNPVTAEQILDAKELPEKDRAPVTALKSKREDWLNYAPVKRRKTEENEDQVDNEIPLDTAIKLLDRNETFGMPLKDSRTTFETYRKMHLEKRSRSLDSSPLN